MIQFILNEKLITTNLPPGTLVLDYVRYHKNLTGTKIGCREGDCGACTVLVGEIKNDLLVYRSVTSCLMALGSAHGKHIVTIEGVNIEGLNYIQQAFAEEGATQCGFCTPGFIVSMAGFCLDHHAGGTAQAIDAVNGNICRCTGYKSIERAVAKVAWKLEERNNMDPISFAIDNQILPAYFSKIQQQLHQLELSKNTNGKSEHAVRFLGGGTDLYVQQHEAMVHASIDFLFDKEDLNGIRKKENTCIMGASVTVSDLAASPIFQEYFPGLKRYIKQVSSTQIRNMATIAGNFVNASPIGDLTIFFLALDAQLLISDGISQRELPLRQFYKGYKLLAKSPEEFIQQVWFELPDKNTGFNFEKVCKRTHLDIASVNTALQITSKENIIIAAGLAAGGVGPIPAFLPASSAMLVGKEITVELVEELIDLAQTEILPISDARGTETYKRLLLAQLIRAHFIELFPTLQPALVAG